MPGILDFLEPLFRGNLKYFSGLVLGTLVILILRLLRMKWVQRENLADQTFVSKHSGEDIEVFKKKSRMIFLSIFILFLVVLPLLMFVSVKVLESVMDVEPWLGVLVVFVEFCVIVVLLIIQGVRGKRLGRRIKLMEKNTSDENSSK